MIRSVVASIMLRSMRKAFRRVVQVGSPLPGDLNRPLVLYANHHFHHDAFLVWLLARRAGRPVCTWMQEWDRFPLFAAAGAMPFPVHDSRARAQTIRRTARRLAEMPRTALIYFPEGVLHPEHEGLRPFSIPPRMHGVLGEPLWCPVAVTVAWTSASKPTAVVGVGTGHERLDGQEHTRLAALHDHVRTCDPTSSNLLLEGQAGPDERLPLGVTRRFFRRYL